MIQLDEYHWVRSAEDVQAIKPMFIPSPMPALAAGRPDPIVDPERCECLIGGRWVLIDRGAQAIARLLSPADLT